MKTNEIEITAHVNSTFASILNKQNTIKFKLEASISKSIQGTRKSQTTNKNTILLKFLQIGSEKWKPNKTKRNPNNNSNPGIKPRNEILQDEENNQTLLVRGSHMKIGGHRVSSTFPYSLDFLLYKP